jgi:hypothetical protein
MYNISFVMKALYIKAGKANNVTNCNMAVVPKVFGDKSSALSFSRNNGTALMSERINDMFSLLAKNNHLKY